MATPKISRRELLKVAGVVAVGPSVLKVSGEALAHTDEPILEDGHIGSIAAVQGPLIVVEYDGSEATAIVPPRHFPIGWKHQVGDRVSVATDSDGVLVAGPFVTNTELAEVGVSFSSVSFGGQEFNVDTPSVRDTIIATTRDGGKYVGLIARNVLTGTQRVFGIIP